VLWVILFYCIYSFLSDIIIIAFSKNQENQSIHYSYILLSLFTVIEYSVFSFCIYSLLRSQILKKIILIGGSLFVVLCIYYYFNSKNYVIDSIPMVIESIALIILVLFYFYEKLLYPTNIFIYSTYHFWIVTGMLIYISGTFFLFIYSDVYKDMNLWVINLVFNTLKNILFSIAFLVTDYTDKDSSGLRSYDNFFSDRLTHYEP
jgi:hypothetical protein